MTDRLIYKYFPSFIEWAPTMDDGSPMVPALGYALADIIILILLIWDWRRHHRLNVFPLVFGLLLTYHITVLFGYKYSLWQRVGDAMMRIPFSSVCSGFYLQL